MIDQKTGLMAPIAKKTYSRKGSKVEVSKLIDESDLFDKLLSSPLKQNVNFKPLSFWQKKSEAFKSKSHSTNKLFSKYSDSNSSTSDSSNASRSYKKRNLIKIKTKQKCKIRSKTHLEKGIEKLSFSPLREENSLQDFDLSNSSKINLDHYSYVNFKRGWEYDFPQTRKKFRSGYCKKQSLELESQAGTDDLETFNLWKTYVIDKKIHKYRSPRTVEEEEIEDSTLKCIGYNTVDENNNGEDTMKKDLTGFFDYASLNNKDTNASNISDLCDSNKENESPQSQNIVSLINGVSDMAISCQSPKATKDKILAEKSYNINNSLRNTIKSRIHNSNMDIPEERLKPHFSTPQNITKKRYKKNLRNIAIDQRNLNFYDEKSLKASDYSRVIESPKFNSTILTDTFQGSASETLPSPDGLINEPPLEISKFFTAPNPLFESTRIGITINNERDIGSKTMLVERSNFGEINIALKPGKQWRRSVSILRKLQKETLFTSHFSKLCVKGRHYETFVEDLVAMQKEISIGQNASCIQSVQDQTRPFSDITKIPLIAENNQENTVIISSDKGEEVNKAEISNYFGQTLYQASKTVLPYSRHSRELLEAENSFDKINESRNIPEYKNNISAYRGLSNRMRQESGDFVSAKDIILDYCGQTDILPFEEYFNKKTLKNCRKIGEGVFGEVFLTENDVVYKVIPIEGDDEVNGEPQKKFEEVLSEIVIASKLSSLKRTSNENQTCGFSEMKRCWCVIGKYPKYLVELWKEYDAMGNGSENDSPEMFKSDQIYIVLELENGGKCLQSFVFNSAEQSLAIFVQTALTLAIAEKVFQFEHRDLHWGNLLISRTKEKTIKMVLDGIKYELPTKGVKVSIIDFTLSRLVCEECCLFNDLSLDPTLFTSVGDYQFEIYRLMQRELKNDWSQYRPRTNIFWLHYVLDKILKSVKYKNRNTQTHKKFMKELKFFESVVLEYEKSSDFIVEYIKKFKRSSDR